MEKETLDPNTHQRGKMLIQLQITQNTLNTNAQSHTSYLINQIQSYYYVIFGRNKQPDHC